MKQVGKYYRSLTEEVYQTLLRAILNNTVKPGSRITMQKLAVDMGVSTSPVKQALAKLAHQGLITMERRGIWVTKLNKKQILERLEMRLLVESYAVETGFSRKAVTSEFVERLSQLSNEFAAANMTRSSLANIAERDLEFHASIVSLADNGVLSEWYENLNMHVHLIVYEGGDTYNKNQRAILEHQSIVDSFREHCVDKVKSNLEVHIDGARSRILSYQPT